MTLYKVLALSISGRYGKTFTKGKIIKDSQMFPTHIANLIAGKAIEPLPVSVEATADILEKHPKLITEGFKEGDQIPYHILDAE